MSALRPDHLLVMERRAPADFIRHAQVLGSSRSGLMCSRLAIPIQRDQGGTVNALLVLMAT
jgi:hypothetical protein